MEITARYIPESCSKSRRAHRALGEPSSQAKNLATLVFIQTIQSNILRSAVSFNSSCKRLDSSVGTCRRRLYSVDLS
ncbi:hypothetical protein QQG55_42570 [Brugia pahangi]